MPYITICDRLQHIHHIYILYILLLTPTSLNPTLTPTFLTPTFSLLLSYIGDHDARVDYIRIHPLRFVLAQCAQ